MEVVRITQSRAAELDFVRAFSPPWEADGEVGIGGGGCGWEGARRRGRASEGKDRCAAGEEDGRLLPVCVTSAASYLGQAIVDCLLNRGYCVRLAFDSQEDLEKLGETEALEGRGEGRISAVTVDLTDVDGLCEVLDGCAGVFHTSAFVDPAGFSGYSKHMAEMEAAVATTVVEASARTPSVRRCVLTSSLLACVWRQRQHQHQHQHQHEHDGHQHHGDCPGPATLDESCWSDETLCREKKLWLALGKTMAERAAWRAASGGDVKLATLCPGLLTGPGSFSRNTSPSVAYLKGGGEMYAAGLLATAEVGGVAEAHVCAYEAMGRGGAACGRYICFDRVVRREEAAAELGRQLGLAKPLSDGASGGGGGAARFELSNGKLRRLMTRRRCSYVAHMHSSQE